MDYLIRFMKEEEKSEVRSLGKKAFTGLESIFFPDPEKALVAVRGNEIIGAVLYKLFQTETKIGYIDFAFVNPSAQGQGVGHRLYDEMTRLFWSEGCQYIGAIVKDDNVESWGLFVNKGYKRLSIWQMLKELGVSATFNQYFRTNFFVATGMEYYILKQNEEIQMEKNNSITQMGAYITGNLLLFSIMGFARGWEFTLYLFSMFLLLTGIISFGFVGTLLSDQKWKYRTMDGGFLVHTIIPVMGGIFPLVGNWYPQTYKKGSEFKKHLAFPAISQWFFLILLHATKIFGAEWPELIIWMSEMSLNLLIMFSIPLYPFESLAAGRVYRWNKLAYCIMLALTVVVILL